jgi:UDP-glucose 4-epimerase/dTDP-L-rhamnose 4-epimerase
MTDSLAGVAGARVLVTGGCGLVGSRIGRRLAELGAVPVCLDRMDAYLFDYPGMFGARAVYREIVRGDVTDPDAVRRAVRGVDYVIHAAAYADVAACTTNAAESSRTNVLGTQVVLDAVTQARPRRFVFVSSASVYGNGQDPGRPQRWSEHTPTHPISVYANAKLWGEWQTRLQLDAAGIEYAVLRYFSVYGEPQVPKPGSHSWCVAWFGFHAAQGLPLRLNHGGRQIRDFIHVDDVAEATIRALVADAAPGQVVNVGTGVGTSVADVAKLVLAEVGGGTAVVAPGPADDPLGGCADTTVMEQVLRFRARLGIADGVRRYASWLRTSDVLSTYAAVLTAPDAPELTR